MVCAAAAVPASAQVADDGDNGPLFGGNPLSTQIVQGRAWSLQGRLVSTYDSNFRRTTPAVSALRLTPLIQVGAGLPVGRQQLFVGGEIGRDYFVNQPDFNRSRYAIGGGLQWRLGTRCSGLVGAETLRRLVAVEEQDEFTNSTQKTDAVAGSLGCQTATGLGFGFAAQRRSISNDAARRSLFNLNTTVISPNISYGNPTIGQISISGTLNDTRYPNRLVVTADGDTVDDGIRILQGRVGYSRSFGTRLQLAVGASYLKTKPQPDAVLAVLNNQVVVVPRESFSGTGYDGSITYQPSQRMTVNVAANRNVNVSANVGAQFVVRTGYAADFTYKLGPSLVFSAGGRISRNRYRQLITAPTATQRVADTSRRVFASLDYSPVPLYSIGLDVGHRTRRSDPADFDFNSTTVRLNLRVRLGRG